MANSKFLSVMVIGDNPDELMKKYDKALKVEPHVVFKYLDAEKMKKNVSKVLTELVNNPEKFTLSKFQRDYFNEKLKNVNSMTPFEYYTTITEGMYYDEDGNAMSDENPDGKWDKYNIGKNFSYPLKLHDGREVYQAKGKDIDWSNMNMNPEYVELFERIWQLAVEDDEPTTKEEENLKVNWKTKKNYLSNFKTMDDFVKHNCAYWNYAFLDKDGWVDMDSVANEAEWINNFCDRFVQKIGDDDLVTIFEYSVN